MTPPSGAKTPPAASVPRSLLALQCASACAGTTLGATVGSGTIGKLITSAGGAAITAFLTAPGRHHPRRIVAVGLLLVLLDEGKAFAAVARHPGVRRPGPSSDRAARGHVMRRKPAGIASALPRLTAPSVVVTTAVAALGFGVGWAVLTSPFVVSPSPVAAEQESRGSTVPVHVSSRPPARGPIARGPIAIPKVAGTPGHVIFTTPVARTQAPRGSTVNPVVTSGPPLVGVPTVAGQSQSVAQTSLQAAGFKPSVSSQPSPTVANGDVISTDPSGGSQAPEESSVQVVVSSGPQQVTVPDVVGMPMKSALQTLQMAGFAPTPSYQPSSTVAPGEVIFTKPIGGTQATLGSPVAVVISH